MANEVTEYLEVWDVVNMFHVSQKTVYEWIRTGKLEGRKAGKKWLFTREAVEALLK